MSIFNTSVFHTFYLLPFSLLLLLTGFLKDDSILTCIASHQLLNPPGLASTPSPPNALLQANDPLPSDHQILLPATIC